ncbi:SUN domain-containing ossification factor-like isoform X2 [Dunckerocampus dactyliophorus]|uniref:SUN domain-containing ossification factor-like isoform X2 n=1 Tax=Dunckerocampus dactyliophorus TaxID=161453 RepID=UPI002404A532|nr:SUN domain-containing ossification factor-like isoform X2 [Dunckerocampus dactyliophorus]
MKMMIWRIASLWLSVFLVFGYPSCYVGCTKPDQEAQSSVPSQDISFEEETGEHTPHLDKEDGSLALLLPPSLSTKEQSQGDDQKEDQTTQAADKKEMLSEAFNLEPTVDAVSEVNNGISHPETEAEPSSNPDVSPVQDPESVILITSTDAVSVSTPEENDSPTLLNSEDNITVSVSDDSSDEVDHEVLDSVLPPNACEEESNPYDHESLPPVVVENMSNAHTAGTKTHTDPSAGSQAGQHLDGNMSHSLKEQAQSAVVTMDTDPSVTSKDQEEIPTFDEWKREVMEKEKTQSTHTSTNGGSNVVKKVQKNFNNYASVECGAKILGANPEAKSTSAILKENMDLYMLNPCSHKIWFIIELCEPVQVKQLDIANFELFSSTPKDFLVSISDRYPTNKWLKLGTFHARDERTVQSFPLDEHLYAKYVKVELLSHFGSEHFCPLSLIRVFGTSMVEEYEEIAEPSERPDDQDDDLDYPSGYGPGEVRYSKNLIGSAKDVILNMVNNIAVNVLGGSSEMQGNISSQDGSVTERDVSESTTPTPITDATTVSELEEATMSPDIVITQTVAPSSASTVVPELLAANISEQQPPPLEAQIVIPLEPEEEESISSTITLLDKEDEFDEEREKMNANEPQNVCAGLALLSSCSCAASLREYLQQQCLVVLFKKRKCQSMDRKQIAPATQTPTWPPPSLPSACPEPKQHHSELHEPHEKGQPPAREPERGASLSEAPQPPENAVVESHYDLMSKPPLLEPSQTSSLPKPSATDSSAASSTVVETPLLSSETLSSEESQDILAVDKHAAVSLPLSSSVISTTVADGTEAPVEVKPDIVVNDSIANPDMTGESQTASPLIEQHPDPEAVPDSDTAPTEPSLAPTHTLTELEPPSGAAVPTDSKTEDLQEDVATPGLLPLPSTSPSPSLSDIYADPPNGTEQNGNPVHGSSQKESVFMRLNNRIKALEMNMSLSGRYLEQLSQRYRKQMEEMQKAFNKTIIKLQNTSRIAEEQDQRQTESIQLLQAQLENMTQMVLNLSDKVSQLQNEVSDRQNYLLLCLLLSLCFTLALFANRCRISITPPHAGPEPPTAKNYTSCCPERHFTSCDDSGLKRSASYPLINSFQVVTTKDPESLHHEESQANRKRRRRKMKSIEEVETLTSCFAAPLSCNGAALCNGVPVTTNPAATARRLLPPCFRDSPSEGSSETSSHSDDPSFCGITTACSRICEGLTTPKTRAEKRALRRRRPKPTCAVVDFLQVPHRERNKTFSISATQDIMNRKSEQSSGTFGRNIPLSGPV